MQRETESERERKKKITELCHFVDKDFSLL